MAADLGLQIGEALLLQPLSGTAQKRYRSQLIGVSPNQSLIITPMEERGQMIAVQEGELFAARAFVGDRAIAFAATVLRVCTSPYRYLHLSYPRQLEEVIVRKTKRAGVGREANLKKGGEDIRVLMLDLSASGCQLEAAPGQAAVGDSVSLEILLPFAGMPDQSVTLAGVVINASIDATNAQIGQYGVEFKDLSPFTTIMLRAFVYEQLSAKPSTATRQDS